MACAGGEAGKKEKTAGKREPGRASGAQLEGLLSASCEQGEGPRRTEKIGEIATESCAGQKK